MNADRDSESLGGSPDTEILEYLPANIEARLAGDFAILVPDDDRTRKAFSDLVDEINRNPHIDPWWRRLIHVRPSQESLMLASGLSDSELEDQQAEEVQIWTGYYRLNLDSKYLPPDFARFGWVIGASALDAEGDPVHIELTPNGAKYQAGRRHARLTMNANSNDLLLVAGKRKAVRIDGEPIGSDLSRVLSPPRSQLQIGTLQYLLEWTELNIFPEQLQTLRASHVLKKTPHLSLQQTPMDSQIKMQLGPYLVRFPAFACGSYGFIYGCIRREGGAAFAVKHLRRTARSHDDIKNEIEIFQRVKGHPNTCELIDIIEAPPLADEEAKPIPINDVYLIHLPLADGDFEGLRQTNCSYDMRLDAFSQVVKGLERIHRDGVNHGDIKPTNLLFTFEPTLRAVVADYGKATREPTSTDHCRGTYFYMAPEVLKLKKGSSQEAYGQAADVYSLGVVGFELFLLGPPAGRPEEFRPIRVADKELLDVESKRYSLRYKMLTSSALSVAPCLRSMSSWESSDRPSTTEIAQLGIWPTWKPGIESRAGQKRKRSTKE